MRSTCKIITWDLAIRPWSWTYSYLLISKLHYIGGRLTTGRPMNIKTGHFLSFSVRLKCQVGPGWVQPPVVVFVEDVVKDPSQETGAPVTSLPASAVVPSQVPDVAGIPMARWWFNIAMGNGPFINSWFTYKKWWFLRTGWCLMMLVNDGWCLMTGWYDV